MRISRFSFASWPRVRPSLELLEDRALPSFLAPFSYEVPGSTFSVITADFNNDNVPDLAATHFAPPYLNNDYVSLNLGRGDGTFETRQLYRPPVRGLEALAAGDFNRDGNCDLAVVAQYGVGIMLGDGKGDFTDGGTFLKGRIASSVAVADLDRDGNLDLVVAHALSLVVLLGDGAGTFRTAGTYRIRDSSTAVAIGHVDGDKHLDLVVTSAGSILNYGTVTVLFGAGDGSFELGATYYSGSSSYSVALEDFNGDGIGDLAVANVGRRSVWDGTVGLLIGKGKGTFADAVQFPTGFGTRYVIATDLNHDGLPDLAVANYGGFDDPQRFKASVRAILNAGDGTFTEGPHHYLGEGTRALASGDFDGDGTVDLAAANSTSRALSVLRGLGDGTFLDAPAYAASPRLNVVATADFNEDGFLDLVTGSAGTYSGNEVRLLLGNGDGSFQPAQTLFPRATDVPQLAAADLDGDGHLDLIVTGWQLYLLFGRGDGTFAEGPSYDFGGGRVQAVILADLNGDGLDDLAVTLASRPGRVRILLGRGDGSFEPAGTYNVGPFPAPKRLTTGDFNDDGLLDLLVFANGSPPSVRPDYFLLDGNGDGTFREARIVGSEYGIFFRVTGDFNADGVEDYLAGQDRASLRAYLGNGDGTYRHGPYDYAIGTPFRDLAVGDFNADSYPDVAVVREDHDTVLILLNTGNGSAPGAGGSGSGPDVVAAALLAADDALRAPAPLPVPPSRELSTTPPLLTEPLRRPSSHVARDQVFTQLRTSRLLKCDSLLPLWSWSAAL